MFTIYADGQLIYQPGNDSLSLISPKLTVEMGKAGSLEFSIPPTSRFYNNLDQIRTKVAVAEDGVELFRGRVLSNKRGFNNVREVYCEGNLSYLVDSCQQGKKFSGDSITLFEKIIAAHNKMIVDPVKQFTIGNITVESHPVELRGQDDNIQDLETKKFDYKQIALNSTVQEWLNTFDYIETTLLDYCGGYLRTRYDAETGKTYIDWLKDYYEVSSQTIQFGKNMLDMAEEITAEDLFTVLIPLGEENLTIKTVNDGSIELADEEAVAKYGRIVQTHVFDGVTKPSTLLANARRYLKAHVEVPVTYEIKAVDLHLINPNIRPIYVGDKVQVLSPVHNIDDNNLVCTKIEYDLTKPENTSYTFGNPKQDLTERYRKNVKNEAGRGGGGGGAAAKKSEESSNANTRDIYDAWVKWDPENATIDIAALFEKLNPGLDKTQIHSKAQILMGANADGSNIDLISEFNSAIDNISNQAGISINTNADRPELTIFVNDKTTGTSANINLGIDYKKTVVEDENGNTHVKYEPRSKIAMESDVTEIDTKVFNLTSEVSTIKTEYFHLDTQILDIIADKLKITANSGYIDVPGIYTGHLQIDNISWKCHTHTLSASSDGKVTCGGFANWSGSGEGGNNFFNIADTAFYKSKVSAIKVKTLKADFTGTYKQNCKVYVQALNEDGVEVKEGTKHKEFTNPYQPSFLNWSRSESGDSYTITCKPYNISGYEITAPNGTSFPSKTYTNNAYKNVTVNSVTNVTHSSAGASFDVNLSNGNTVRRSIFW